MRLNGVHIEDTFAEAFPMLGTRLIVTADTPAWVQAAVVSMTGFATSVIACGCEAAMERPLPPGETPDARPGAAVLLFAMSKAELAKQVARRVGQCVMTCPGTACYAGLREGAPGSGQTIPLGNALRYFGDGWQIAKRVGTRRYWRIPVMDGEFLCEAATGTVDGVGGGNFIILAADRRAGLAAAQAAVMAIRELPGAILPFPGGVVRSGSKIGGKYKGLIASTNTAFCPTLRAAAPASLVPEGVESILELVIDGVSAEAVAAAMRAGIAAVVGLGAAGGVVSVTAGNYGGKLGRYQFRLHEVMA
ncbi:formylmethanofuran--tetrahydromethanopterin N-formyltransferase [Roseomonas genomospecies 6]|uniref:Formylmethanofuran--tetrahydromethanopterin formyltransferase n=1 Tax=Roseomonas genomospecies 6 TaxID=214106 RepID=A0A9W7NFR2_9PROT|nr:formylmethanofuran--tetrahydromethanopterin N-formyltransferase [Roseomonas genomospecies 6]KAA0676906.1 formylmethanofuran--tetrahydromethanopterin N-formyltransferase [Roseomonas genomospecies 6]